MQSKDHNTLITAAAKAALRPIGCMQTGRSRTWLDDHGWWVGIVEFQPSSWAKGTYLNVGACWLWAGNDHLGFNEIERVDRFCEFKDQTQFGTDVAFIA